MVELAVRTMDEEEAGWMGGEEKIQLMDNLEKREGKAGGGNIGRFILVITDFDRRDSSVI